MNNKTKGIICIIASAFFFSLMSLFVRMAGELPDALSICGYMIIIAMAVLKWHHNMNS